MKRTICMIAVLLLFNLTHRAFAEEITVRLTNGEWPPYQSEHLEHAGIASRIVCEAFALEGIHVEYGFYPWNRSYMLAKKGEWDGTLVWSYSEERAKDFYYSDPVIHSTWVFFHLKTTSFAWNTIDDLKDFKIGGTIGYFYDKDLQETEETGKIAMHRIGEDEQNFILLLKKRIQIFPQDTNVGYTTLSSLFSREEAQLFTHHPRPIKAEPFFLILSKKIERNKELIAIFNRGLKQLQESGKVDQYLQELRQVNTSQRQ